jgi:tRNA pseudouridine38-40 synthase
MRTIKLTISYDGCGYVGWQMQPNGNSIQAELARAIKRMTGEGSVPVGAGRTDAGVHALAQVASFATESPIPCDGFVHGLNSLLPSTIAVLFAEEVSQGFDARRDARGKVYRYDVLRSAVRLPLFEGRAWQMRGALDLAAMRESALLLVGKHDFESFRASGCAAMHAVRTIQRIDVSISETTGGQGELLSLTFEGDGFVRHMIRNIVGTLVNVGQGKLLPGDIQRILEARQRKEAGVCAPACGLYLVRVLY